MIFNYIQSKVEFSSTALSNKCITEPSVHTDYFIMAMMLRMKTKCNCTGMTGIQKCAWVQPYVGGMAWERGEKAVLLLQRVSRFPKEKLKESTLDTPDKDMKVNAKKYL